MQSMNPAHAALQYVKWLSVKDWWFIQDKGSVSVQQSPVLQEPLPGSNNCMDRDSSTHSPPEVTSSELGWGTLAGQCGEACIAAALAIPVLWRNRGLNFQGCSQHLPHYKWRKKKWFWQCLFRASTFWGVVKNPHFLLKYLDYFHIFCGAPFVCPASKLDSLVHELMMLLPVTYIASWYMAIENQLN